MYKDVIEVVDENDENIAPGSYFTDSIGFKRIDFDSSRCIGLNDDDFTELKKYLNRVLRCTTYGMRS